MTEETKVMMAVRTPSFQRGSWMRAGSSGWIQKLGHVATCVDPVMTSCYHVHLLSASCSLAAKDAAKAELSLYTRSILSSQEFSRGDHEVAFVALRVHPGRRSKMSVIRSRKDFKIKSLGR